MSGSELLRAFLRRSSVVSVLLSSSVGLWADEHPSETDADRVPRLATGGDCVIRGATIHSGRGPAFVGDVLVVDGDIAAVGERVDAPAGTLEIDAKGRHLAPGVVDCHSHIAVHGNVNEGTVSISAEVRIEDVLDADDIAIYRALAGGVTTARLLHGSANAIGGQDEVIKLRWKATADELRFPGGPRGIKFALGENPKRSNWGEASERFPNTRSGVEATFYRAFSRAKEYARSWDEFEAVKARGEDPVPPRRDLRLEALADILDGELLVHAHCYRADEILMLIRASEHYGFKIATLQHVLEGYKVAAEIAAAGVGGSTFGDWWAYKVEAYDAIPQNAALMDAAGVLTSLNSDSAEMMRRLYAEAAKSVRYAGMDPVRALQLVTLNPARQLGIDDRVGSIEVGKDADLVLLTQQPLSAFARVEWTMVDGEVEFQRRDAFGLDGTPVAAAAPAGFAPITSEPPPGAADRGAIALVGGTIHPVTASPIERGTLVMRAGRIVAVGAGVEVPRGARVLDVAGQHVYPGLIALDTPIGLREIGAVGATVDVSEIGGDQPDLRVSASINAESAHIPVTRANGVTRVQTAPKGGGPLLGQSAVIRLVGDTWEELLMVDRDMLHVSFPRTANDALPADRKKAKETIRELARTFEKAREYGSLAERAAAANAPPPPFDPRLDALVPFARGRKRVALHAENAQTILSALDFARDQGLDAVLFGAGEGWKVADAIARAELPVVVGPVLALPASPFDPYDAPYSNPAVLQRAGVRVAIMPGDDQNPRNLAFHAAMAAAFGLSREAALQAITYEPAKVLGIDGEVGSLAVGKIADVVVSDGDPLEITSRVTHVFIEGAEVSLDNRQTGFYERYRARLQGSAPAVR